MKQALAVLALTLGIPASNAFSQPTTISYDAKVTYSGGPHAAFFSVGDEVVVSYTLDPSVPDADGDPVHGAFPNAVLSLSVSFPGIGVSVVAAAAGPAATFDNVVDTPTGTWSDQVSFQGGPISSSSLLGGELIDFVEVGFLSDFVFPPEEPTMLSSDALPLFRLPTTDATLFLRTSSGYTQVDYQAINPPPEVNLEVNGQDAVYPFVVDVTGNLRLTIDMAPGRTPLDHYYALIVGGAVYWVTPSGGLSLTPEPLATFAPVALSDYVLLDAPLPAGLWGFAWLMLDGGTVVHSDVIAANVIAP